MQHSRASLKAWSISIFSVVALLCLPLSTLQAFNYGKIDASRGVACNACHNGGIAPSVTLTGPENVVPGSINRYTVTITGGQQNQGGFNVSVSDGTVSTVSPGTWVTNNQIHHYIPAQANNNGVISWEFDWTAPVTDSTQVLYAAGLSTNASGSEFGDAAATTSLTVTVGTGGTLPPPVETGESLYISNCQTCHGAAPGPKAGRTATQIQTAIDNNTGGMGSLSILTVNQVQLIAEFLGSGNNAPQAPVADPGGPYVAIVGDQILFDGTASSDTDGNVVSYSWDFGDGTTATGATPAHSYTAEGLYTVTLTVTDNSAMTHSATTTANIAVGTPPTPVYDGVALYNQNCAGCHGALANSNKQGRSAAQIQNAINNNTGGMGAANLGLIDLIPAEVQAIADALAGGNSPQAPVANHGGPYSGIVGVAMSFDGTASFDSDGSIVSYAWDFGDGNVATGATPTHTYATSGQFTVSLTVTDDSNMTGSTTTTANIGVNTPPPPVLDGLALYNTNCASCHGAAPGSKANRTANQIQSAIDLVQAMNGLTALTAEEVQAIADAINQGGSPTPTGGEALYNQYCSSCHGAEGKGGTEEAVTGESAEGITDAINGEADMQYLSALLSAEQIAEISAYLNGEAGQSGFIEVSKQSQYDTYCAACHGAEGRGGTEGDVRGEQFAGIKDAINKETEMNYLANLSDEIVQAIADYLNGDDGSILIPAPPPGNGTTDGLTLYANNCAGCHGAAPGSKADRSAGQIQAAIDGVPAMSGLTGLTAAEVQAIADAIVTGGNGGPPTPTPTPTDGLTLYTNNCAGCHGAAPGSKADRSASQIQAAIDGVPAMSGLTGLTAAEVQAIADAIVTGGSPTPTPTDGLTLYANNCEGCHGPAPGSKAGRNASQIQVAIDGVPAMSGLTGLTATEVQAIADAIGGNNAPPPPTTPEGLYATYCAACHDPDGRGGSGGNIRGSSVEEIMDAVAKETEMNYLDSILAEGSIQSIAEFLAESNTDNSREERRREHRRRDREHANVGSGSPSAGGGCSLGMGSPFDPTLPALLLGSVWYLCRTRLNRNQADKIQ